MTLRLVVPIDRPQRGVLQLLERGGVGDRRAPHRDERLVHLVVPLAEVHTLPRSGREEIRWSAKSKPFGPGSNDSVNPIETNLILSSEEAEAVGDLERDGSLKPLPVRVVQPPLGVLVGGPPLPTTAGRQARRWPRSGTRSRIRRRHGGCLGSLAHIRRRSGTEQVYRRGTPAGRTLPASTGPRARGCTSAWARASRPCSRFDGTSAG